jgi:hypothetical protein
VSPCLGFGGHDVGVARRPSGEFAVTWREQGASGRATVAQRFDAGGTPIGSIHVSEYTSVGPDVAFGGAGDFVVVWGEYTTTYGAGELRARRWDADGAPLTASFPVHEPAGNPGVAVDRSSGSLIVVWDEDPHGIAGQRFAFGEGCGPTLPPCSGFRCTVDAVVHGPCATDSLPAAVGKKLDRAAFKTAQAAEASDKRARALRRKAVALVRAAARKAAKAAKRGDAPISAGCAAAILALVDRV